MLSRPVISNSLLKGGSLGNDASFCESPDFIAYSFPVKGLYGQLGEIYINRILDLTSPCAARR
ncbi:MAG: hypothetical protein JWQ14_2741 [Adhaeribacter sp.]|nr:hypothetical protein [Adhaeribacter sp.]